MRALFTLILCLVFALTRPLPIHAADGYSPLSDSPVSKLISSDLPIDIPLSIEQEKKLQKQNFPALQRIFDEFSWQSFIALSWPTDASGKPKPSLSDPGDPAWLSMHESLQVFRPDGAAPGPEPIRMCRNAKANPGMRELYATSSVFSNTFDQDIADETDQAFTSPLYDQNGNEVRYEIFLNDEEYNYIVSQKLYNLDGQIEFSSNHLPVNFPSGDTTTGSLGATEIKLAWKILDPQKDIPSRFYKQTLLLPDLKDNGEPDISKDGYFKHCSMQDVGLVGMHISTKTKSSPQWIWATFEHVDNLNVNDLVSVNGKPLQALFHDYSAAGQTLPVNVPPIRRDPITGKPDEENGILKTQVSRPIPIPEAKQALNRELQKLLSQQNSPLQYYQLIDTQWPTAPYPNDQGYAAIPGSPFPGMLPDAITHKSIGSPAPVYLTNSIMETYLQTGNQKAHFQENGFPFSNTKVFGTESCMACHYSAGIASGYTLHKGPKDTVKKIPIFAGDASADFSWLPQLKAKWAK